MDVIYQGCMIAIVTIIAYIVGHYMESGVWEFVNSKDSMTMAFLTMSMAEIFHSFNMRSRTRSIFRLKTQHRLLWITMACSLVLTAAVVFIPFLREIFSFADIGFGKYLVAFLIAAVIIPISEAVKIIFHRGKSAKQPGLP